MRNKETSSRGFPSSGPTSPPQTPMAASSSVGKRGQSTKAYGFPTGQPPQPKVPGSGIGRPVGFGLNLGGGAFRPDHTPGSSSPASDKFSDSPPHSVTSEAPGPALQSSPHDTERIVTTATFIVEELSDFHDSDEDRLGVVRPDRIEDAETDRSRSRTRNPPEIDRTVDSLSHLHCSDDSESSDIDEDTEFHQQLRQQREAKRLKRMNSGSIGKRTISESIGSDTDLEDLKPFLDVNEPGSSARRLRRRVGDRRSLLFQDPPPPRIDELEEPNTSEDELVIERTLARELPYYTLDIINMEIDSP